jgi:hypothetical protein
MAGLGIPEVGEKVARSGDHTGLAECGWRVELSPRLARLARLTSRAMVAPVSV